MDRPSRGPHAPRVAPTIEDVQRATLPRSPSVQRAFAVPLGPLSYALAWAIIYSFHAGCALYCFAAAAFFRATQHTFVVQAFDINHSILPSSLFPAVAIVHCIVGAAHACFSVAPLASAFYRFITNRCYEGPSRTDSVMLSRLRSVQLPQAAKRCIPVALHRTAKTVYARVFARHGLLGIESRQFDSMLLVRETVENVLQTFQAYQMCQALPRRGLNRLYVALLVTNCWTTPLLHHVVRHKPLQRLLDRLCDVALDFLAAVGIPVILVAHYWPLYDTKLGNFPEQYWSDAVWSAIIRSESPLVFFGSWVDALSRLVFSVGLLLSLDDIKILLVRRRATFAAVKPHPSVQALTTQKTSRGTRKVIRYGHRLLFSFGCVVLAIHLYSELLERPKSCLLELNPWFVAKPTCVIVEFSCYANRALTEDARDFDSVFGNLNPSRLEHINFRHCPAIDVEPSILQFRNLDTVRFYNSTVRVWGAGAALTNVSHPKLRSFYAIRTNFTGGVLPDGLLSRDFPQGVIDTMVSFTNLEDLPDDLGERWPPGQSMCIEFSKLAKFPRINAIALMLAGNALTEVPGEAFEQSGLMTLGLSGNPIVHLPETVALASGVYAILLDSTNLSELPMWLTEAATMGIYVSAGRTPYCENLLTNATTSERSSSIGTTEVPSWPIDCTDTGGVVGVYWSPVDQRDSEVW